ncbi:MAG: PDZ domain-containing protein [Pseudomonadota bacterium]|nr:PDZ domain-containing protein [Pseudomonadota bacterium]
MKRGKAVLLVIGAAASFLAAFLLLQLKQNPEFQDAQADSPTPLRRASVENEMAQIAEKDLQIDGLKAEVGALRANLEAGKKGAPDQQSLQGSQARLMEASEKLRDFQTSRLLAAGFSPERISFIEKRSAELQAQRQRAQRDARTSGPGEDPDMAAAYSYDKDLDLRYEIGDDEYEKYRSALGRPTGIRIREVPPGSSLEHSGLRPGDEIVRYEGKRVFNIGELNSLASKSASGEFVTVEVRSDGQVRQVLLPRQRLNIPAPYVAPSMSTFPSFQ